MKTEEAQKIIEEALEIMVTWRKRTDLPKWQRVLILKTAFEMLVNDK